MNRKFSWRRAVFLGVALFVVVIGSPFIPMALSAYHEYRANRIEPVVASNEEFESILHVMLSDMQFGGVPLPPPEPGDPPRQDEEKPIVVVDETVAFCEERHAAEPGCTSLGEAGILYSGIDAQIPAKFRKELIAANRAPVRFSCIPSKLVQCAKRESVLSALANNGSWYSFYKKFPNTAGFIEVGNVVLSSDGESALAYVAYSCGSMCGAGTLVQLKRMGTSWVIAKQVRAWDV